MCAAQKEDPPDDSRADQADPARRYIAARVRLEDLLPNGVPQFVGMKLEGGFLRDQVIHFNPNLTCIIGGHRAGKSTLLEALRVCSGNAVDKDIVNSEVWPDAITLIYEDKVGHPHTLMRSKLNPVVNSDPDVPAPLPRRK